MELICKITDGDIGEKIINMDNPKLRLGARGIVIREDGKIAIFNKSNKNEYKLPGGGLEGKEKPEDSFKREVLEETGCEVEIIDTLGTIEEYKSLNNFKQISYVFVGKVLNDTKQLNVTQKEKDEGARLLWIEPSEALELVKNCINDLKNSQYENVYATKFVVLRDSIYNLLKEQEHEFIVITARGGFIKEMKNDAIRLLNENNIKFDKYYWKVEDKLEICKKENVDIMIDDDWKIIKN